MKKHQHIVLSLLIFLLILLVYLLVHLENMIDPFSSVIHDALTVNTAMTSVINTAEYNLDSMKTSLIDIHTDATS